MSKPLIVDQLFSLDFPSQTAPKPVDAKPHAHFQNMTQIFQKAQLTPKSAPFPLTVTADAGEVPGDVSAVIRTVPDVIGSELISTSIQTSPNPMIPAMGLTTALNVVWGGYAADRAYHKAKAAEKVGDHKEETLRRIEFAGRIMQVAGGATYIGVRALSLDSMIRNYSIGQTAPSILGRVGYFISTIGSSLFTAFFAMLAVITGKRLYDLSDFEAKLTRAKEREGSNHDEAGHSNELVSLAKFLEKRVLVDKEAIQKKIADSKNFKADAVYELGINDLIEKYKQFYALAKENGTDLQSLEMTLFALEELNGEHLNLDEALKVMLTKVFSYTDILQHGMELQVNAKKESKMSRLTSSKLVELVKKSNEHPDGILSARLSSTSEKVRKEAEAELKTIETELTRSIEDNKKLGYGLEISIILSIVGSILLFFPTALTLLIGSIIYLVGAIGFTIVDGTYFHRTLMSMKSVGKHDEAIAWASIAICIVSIILGSILFSLFVFGSVATGGILPLVTMIAMGLSIGLPWITVNALAIKKIREIKAQPTPQMTEADKAERKKAIEMIEALLKDLDERYIKQITPQLS